MLIIKQYFNDKNYYKLFDKNKFEYKIPFINNIN